ncbi:MAG TPA: DUF6249 domain-containing protein [Candidatus Acidoferrum sp.]
MISTLKEMDMGDVGVGIVGLAAVVLSLGIPMAAMYTYYRVKKLRADERMAAIARGITVPFETEVTPTARSRKNGILLVSGAIGFMATFGAIAGIEHEPDTWSAAAFGLIPLAIGIGYFVDFTLTRREAHS